MSNLSSHVRWLALAASLARAAEPGATITLWPQEPPSAPAAGPELAALGERVYRGACVNCHGEKGDGLGPEGKLSAVPPTDFTTGEFHFRSTPAGTLPLDVDVFHSIRRGMRSDAGMPAYTFLTDREVWAVVAYLKRFSPRWEKEQPGKRLELAPRPPPDVEAGKAVFLGAGACFACHGMTGKGDGPAAIGLKYSAGAHAGRPWRLPDFTRREDFKGGSRPEDVYRSISTGLHGTPMPGFTASLTDAQRWQLVTFILSLSGAEAPSSQGAVP
ncbi:MAG: c-type cytochrome [Myxococcota bacterium]